MQEDGDVASTVDVAVPRAAKITGPFGQVNIAVTYDIECRKGASAVWTATKRYSEFDALDVELRRVFGTAVPPPPVTLTPNTCRWPSLTTPALCRLQRIPNLPGKRLFGNLSDAFIEERRAALETWLRNTVRVVTNLRRYDCAAPPLLLHLHECCRVPCV